MKRWQIQTALSLVVALAACQPLQGSNPQAPDSLITNHLLPGSKGILPGSKGVLPSSKGITDKGQVGIRFDLGQNLTPADFEKITQAPFTTPPLGFKLLQAAATVDFSLTDIASATVTMTSPLVEEPATATLTSKDIAQGWSVLFEDIPAGPAAVELKILGKNGKPLFTDTREVEVVAGAVVPVNFTLELTGPTSCQLQCTGSIKVTVNAITACFGQVSLSPFIAKNGETVTAKLLELQGKVDRFEVNFGDGSAIQTVQSLPLTHKYQTAGRYPVSVTLDGEGCKSPYTSRAFVTVQP